MKLAGVLVAVTTVLRTTNHSYDNDYSSVMLLVRCSCDFTRLCCSSKVNHYTDYSWHTSLYMYIA